MSNQLSLPLNVPCQRWRDRRDSYRPSGEVIDTKAYSVDIVERAVAKAFVEQHHYSGSFPAARLSVGLFKGTELAGVAVFSQPMNVHTIAKYSDAADGCELGRLVLRDDVEANGETWFLARAFKALKAAKPELGMVVSYSDPVVRTTADGRVVKKGHFGIIYRAFNGRYVGRAGGNKLLMDREGRIISPRTISKLRNGERGAAYAYRQLVDAGAPERNAHESDAAYVARAVTSEAFRTLQHPGNLTYLWPLRREVTLKLPALPFVLPSPIAARVVSAAA